MVTKIESMMTKNESVVTKIESVVTKTESVHTKIDSVMTKTESMPMRKINVNGQSKKISNDQELIQSDPISCPQNKKGK